MKLLCCLLVLVFTGVARAGDGVTVLRYRPPSTLHDQRYHYFVSMLDLAMRETRADYGDYRLEPAAIPISQQRAFALLHRGRYLNVAWSMTSNSREREARPVRIPLLKGLLGYRVLLVRRADVKGISAITDAAQLLHYRAVQGSDWPDTAILRYNGLNVIASGDYDGMFEMLIRHHADYFPRSVAEVRPELRRYAGRNLRISPSPLLVYRAPIYFFVRPQDRALAQRLATGLRRAIADGSFERHFMAREEVRWAVNYLRHGHYRVIPLKNPLLPAATPVHDAALWLQIPKVLSALPPP